MRMTGREQRGGRMRASVLEMIITAEGVVWEDQKFIATGRNMMFGNLNSLISSNSKIE